ncbi:MAG TPA: carboxypeptidase regulatory-like domain-containing protein [Oscillatoriaceae cyanobacterium]
MRLRHLLPAFTIAAVFATFGCGYQQAQLLVRVVDADTGNPLPGANVMADGVIEHTNGNGVAPFTLHDGSCLVTVARSGYVPATASILLDSSQMVTQTIALHTGGPLPTPTPAPSASPVPGVSPSPTPQPSARPSQAPVTVTVGGRVTNPTGTRLKGAYVFVTTTDGRPLGSAVTDNLGQYSLGGLPAGEPLDVTAIATGDGPKSRVITPTGNWHLDFTGFYGLSPDQPPVIDGNTLATVNGEVDDNSGAPLDGVLIQAQAYGTNFAYQDATVAHDGHFSMRVPTNIPLRFSAQKPQFRTMSFIETIPDGGYGEQMQVDFTQDRALIKTP